MMEHLFLKKCSTIRERYWIVHLFVLKILTLGLESEKEKLIFINALKKMTNPYTTFGRPYIYILYETEENV